MRRNLPSLLGLVKWLSGESLPSGEPRVQSWGVRVAGSAENVHPEIAAEVQFRLQEHCSEPFALDSKPFSVYS